MVAPLSEGAVAADDYANRIILEFLHKKGYRRAEQALLEESAAIPHGRGRTIEAVDDELRNAVLVLSAGPSSEADARRLDEAYCELRDWVDGSLDVYKGELHAVLYPFLIHCFLELIRLGTTREARDFLASRGAEWRDDSGNNPTRTEELQSLSGVASMQHLHSNHVARLFLENRYELHFTPYAFELLISFLTGDMRRLPLLRLLNQRCRVHVDAATSNLTSSMTGFSVEDEAASLKHREILWGTLKPDLYILPDEINERKGQAGEEDKDEPRPEVNADGEITVSLVPLPKFRVGVAGIPTPRSVSGKFTADPPSVLFFTVMNESSAKGLNSIAMSVGGKLVAGGMGDSSIWVWDNDKGSGVTLTGHAGPIFTVDVSSCERYALSGSEDGTLRLWSVQNSLKANLVAYRGHNYPVWSCQFSPLGYYFASGSHDRTARVWCTERIAPLRVFAGHLADVDCIRWHPNCNYIATGSSDRTARLWDIRSGDCVRVLCSSSSTVQALDFHPHGRQVAVADASGEIRVVDIAEGRVVGNLQAQGSSVWSLSYSRGSGGALAAGSADGLVSIWHGADERATAFKTKSTSVQFVQYSPKNVLFAAGAYRPRERPTRASLS